MRIAREELLKQLESVSAGLAKREVIEQSQCFVFKDGRLLTFNDEVAAWCECQMDGLQGAVLAIPLLSVLRKMPEDELDIEVAEGGLMIKGKGRRSYMRMEEDILLPIDVVERPDSWTDVPEDLVEALRVASSCCAPSESHFVLTCVHITPKFVEASDDIQIVRYQVETGVVTPILIRRDSVMKATDVGPTEWSLSDGWAHFRNPSGLVLSCRLYHDKYVDVGKHLKEVGTETKFPKGIDVILDRAQVFSSENPGANQVEVELKVGRLCIRGQGSSGWYEERQKTDYKGDPLKFVIEPKLMLEISRKANVCLVSDGKIFVDSGKFRYVACTGMPEEK